MTEFIAMGGYGYYVWSAYGLSVVVLVLNLAVARWRDREVRKDLHRSLGDTK